MLIQYQLRQLGFPSLMVLNKEKQIYYRSFNEYKDSKNPKTMEKVVALALLESLHKRLAYLRGDAIITLADHAKTMKKSIHAFSNAARRQTIPAFREKGVWKIGVGIPAK